MTGPDDEHDLSLALHEAAVRCFAEWTELHGRPDPLDALRAAAHIFGAITGECERDPACSPAAVGEAAAKGLDSGLRASLGRTLAEEIAAHLDIAGEARS